jgi:hypothetical protein
LPKAIVAARYPNPTRAQHRYDRTAGRVEDAPASAQAESVQGTPLAKRQDGIIIIGRQVRPAIAKGCAALTRAPFKFA